MKVTIKDIARVLDVSPSTVSRALHNNQRISQEVRDRVQQVAREMNFHPNQMARSLVSRKSRIVGIVFPGNAAQKLGNPFFPLVLQGLGSVAGARRYHLLLATGTDALSSMEAGRQLVDSGYVSGLILLAAEDAPAEPLSVPVVLVGRPPHECIRLSVDNNNVEAGYQAARYLLDRGHRRLMFLGFDRQYLMTVDRRKGFEKALTEAGQPLDESLIIPSRYLENESDHPRLRQLFQGPDRPTGAVCIDDALAIGLCGFLKQMGLNVPRDVSLISYNNTEAGRYHSPALTSFDVNAYQLGVSAMNLMLDVIRSGREAESRAIEVPFALMERDSVEICH